MDGEKISYEIMETNLPEASTFGIRLSACGISACEIPDVSGNKRNVENVIWLYNENHLLPEEFERTTELLLGVLL